MESPGALSAVRENNLNIGRTSAAHCTALTSCFILRPQELVAALQH